MVEEFKEGIPIQIGNNPYIIQLDKGTSGANYISIKRDTGKKWESCTREEIFKLIVDGLKFQDLRRAEIIKKELSK